MKSTDEAQITDAFKQSETLFRALIENSSDAIVLNNDEGYITYASSSIERLLGYPPDEFRTFHPSELIHPDDRQPMAELFATLLEEQGKSVTTQYRIRHKNGSWRWVEGTGKNLLTAPTIQSVVINIHDITERKQAEERQRVLNAVSEMLASSLDHDVTLQEITRLLVPSLADYCRIAIVDEKQQIKDIAAHHIEPEKIALVRELYEQYKDRASSIHGLQKLLQSGQAELISFVSQEVLTPIGQENPELLTIVHTLGLQSYMGVPLLAHGRIIGAITFSSIQPSRHYTLDDLMFAQEVAHRIASALENARLYREAQEEIAKRKKAEEEHYRLAAIVESSNDAIIGKALNGIITSWNYAAEQLFGYTAQEAIGKPITFIIPPELHQEEKEIIDKLVQDIRIQHDETVRIRKDGTKVDVSLSISPVKDSEGNIIGAAKIARDITERKELERHKDEFISMASHELKTPVTSLKGFTQLLHRRFRQRDDEESLRLLARMDAQIDNLTKLISDLLDISKMQTGQLAYREEPFDLDMLVQEVVENVQGITQTHRLVVENPARVCVYADRDRIGQVLINLLTNAIKYSSNADQVIVQVATDGTHALVSVQDFGMGIAEPYQEKIFERFYQVNEPEMKTYPGLGIGLYIASEIIKRHQGRIWVQSRKGEGSTFSFSLPLLPLLTEHVSL